MEIQGYQVDLGTKAAKISWHVTFEGAEKNKCDLGDFCV